MTLTARLSRIEQKHAPANPFEAPTDEELEVSIETLSPSIAAQHGQPSIECVADMLNEQLKAGQLAVEMDEKLASDFIRAVKRRVARCPTR